MCIVPIGLSILLSWFDSRSHEDIAKAYRLAKDLHCKGITVYRDQSKVQQVLYSGTKSRKDEKKEIRKPEVEQKVIELMTKVPDKYLKLDATFDPACPTGKCDK